MHFCCRTQHDGNIENCKKCIMNYDVEIHSGNTIKNMQYFPMLSSTFTICYYVNNYCMLLYSILWSPSCWILFFSFFACSFFILFIRFNMELHFVHTKNYIIVHEHQLSCLIKSTLLVVDFYYCFFTVIAYIFAAINPFSHHSR